jgi:hypothetical protein
MKVKKRDLNIVKSYQGEINMNTRTIKNKKAYNRKAKHKAKSFDYHEQVIYYK